jgi:bacterioferritin-associated ferredoxin
MEGYLPPSPECHELFVCPCLRVTENAVIRALTSLPISNLKDLREMTGAGEGCTCCHERLKKLVDRYACAGSSPICSVK